MFGLEEQKKKEPQKELIFDLEKDMSKSEKQKELKSRIEARLQRIKQVLRSGEDKEEFDHFGTLLHGYAAFLKVISRVKTTE